MKTLSDVIVDLNAVVAAATQAITDLTEIINAIPVPPTADPVVEIDEKTASGVVTTFIPKV